jgi:hypothetical protein
MYLLLAPYYTYTTRIPSCPRNLGDFHEKDSSSTRTQAMPFVSCEDDIVIGNNDDSNADTCSLGQGCETEADCVIEGFTYENPYMVCGGKKCPAATGR